MAGVLKKKIGVKVCGSCKKSKPFSEFEFQSDENKRFYYRRICNNCQRGRESTKWDNHYTLKIRMLGIKQRAKERGYEFSISFEEYKALMSVPCYYCFGAIGETSGGGLDRLDNTYGYELGNVVPCCGVCNRARGDWFTPEETREMIGAVLKMRRGL